jgi:hypothetical protein
MGLGGSHPPTAQQQGATVADERDGYYIVEVPATVGAASYWLVALSGVGDIGKHRRGLRRRIWPTKTSPSATTRASPASNTVRWESG